MNGDREELDGALTTEVKLRFGQKRRRRRRRFVGGLMLVVGSMLGVVFLLPAVCPRTPPALQTRTSVELVQLEHGLMKFKARFGHAAPCTLKLTERLSNLDVVSRSQLRPIWPQLDFDQEVDFNRDGDTDDTFELNGGECLVFFLGGITVDGRTIGVSLNPVAPFNRLPENRTTFFEFEQERLVDVDNDGFREFADHYNGLPYFYWTEENNPLPRKPVETPIPDSNLWRPYRYGDSVINLQIVSAGYDGRYGVGGMIKQYEDPPREDRDNVTNFSHGELQDH